MHASLGSRQPYIYTLLPSSNLICEPGSFCNHFADSEAIQSILFLNLHFTQILLPSKTNLFWGITRNITRTGTFLYRIETLVDIFMLFRWPNVLCPILSFNLVADNSLLQIEHQWSVCWIILNVQAGDTQNLARYIWDPITLQRSNRNSLFHMENLFFSNNFGGWGWGSSPPT
jgi:hypothetical protein